MQRFLKRNAIIVSLVFSLILHVSIFSMLAFGNSYISDLLSMKNVIKQEQEEVKETKVTFLIESAEEETIEKNETFLSDRNVEAVGQVTRESGYNIPAEDANVVVLSDANVDSIPQPSSVELKQEQTVEVNSKSDNDKKDENEEKEESKDDPEDNGEIELKEKSEKSENSDKAINLNSTAIPDLLTPNSTSSDYSVKRRMPTSYDESDEIKLGLNLQEGLLTIGSALHPYAAYFAKMYGNIRKSWYESVPIHAHSIGLIKDDMVDALMSLDSEGNIDFVKFLSKSTNNQNSLDNSVETGIKYAESISEPPEELMSIYAIDGKLYIPIRFVYKNTPPPRK